jgi:hypothetical protein
MDGRPPASPAIRLVTPKKIIFARKILGWSSIIVRQSVRLALTLHYRSKEFHGNYDAIASAIFSECGVSILPKDVHWLIHCSFRKFILDFEDGIRSPKLSRLNQQHREEALSWLSKYDSSHRAITNQTAVLNEGNAQVKPLSALSSTSHISPNASEKQAAPQEVFMASRWYTVSDPSSPAFTISGTFDSATKQHTKVVQTKPILKTSAQKRKALETRFEQNVKKVRFNTEAMPSKADASQVDQQFSVAKSQRGLSADVHKNFESMKLRLAHYSAHRVDEATSPQSGGASALNFWSRSVPSPEAQPLREPPTVPQPCLVEVVDLTTSVLDNEPLPVAPVRRPEPAP